MCAGLRRGVNHAVRILMNALTRDIDGAASTYRRGVENLTVGQRNFLGVNDDTARD